MKPINLVYMEEPNFGDQLSPYIVGRLSGMPVFQKDGYGMRHSLLLYFLRFSNNLFHRRFSRLKHLQAPWDRCLVAVGSILGWGNSRALIWGAGFMNKGDRFHGGRVFALRGEISYKKLKGMGSSLPEPAYGDPALLLPLITKGSEARNNQVGLVPHWRETDYFKTHYGNLYEVIDLRTRDIESVVRRITSCRLILSTSLHGLIVAHAYAIPALHLKHGYIDTDGFKFRDYYSSVGIEPYEGFTNIDEILALSPEGMDDFFDAHWQSALPQTDLNELRRKLLRAAPFPLLDHYKNLCRSNEN